MVVSNSIYQSEARGREPDHQEAALKMYGALSLGLCCREHAAINRDDVDAACCAPREISTHGSVRYLVMLTCLTLSGPHHPSDKAAYEVPN